MVIFYLYAEDGTCPTAVGAVVGSDSPPDCHSLPTLQVPFHYQKKKRDTTNGISLFDAEDGT